MERNKFIYVSSCLLILATIFGVNISFGNAQVPTGGNAFPIAGQNTTNENNATPAAGGGQTYSPANPTGGNAQSYNNANPTGGNAQSYNSAYPVGGNAQSYNSANPRGGNAQSYNEANPTAGNPTFNDNVNPTAGNPDNVDNVEVRTGNIQDNPDTRQYPTQVTGFLDVLEIVEYFINTLMILCVGIATVFFLKGLLKYVGHGGDSEEVKKARNYIIIGVIVLTAMVSVYGLVRIVIGTFFGANSTTILGNPKVR